MAMVQSYLFDDWEAESDKKGIDLLPINEYKYLLVNISAGKDSLASFLDLLDRGVDESKIILCHQEVDGRGEAFMDWPCTSSYIRALAEYFDVPVTFQYREGGILREMLREESPTAGVWYEENGQELVYLPTVRSKNSTRRKWPSKGSDLKTRWCSSYVKIDPFKRMISSNPKYNSGTQEDPLKILVITGERRQESSNRAKYDEALVHPSNSSRRIVHHWRNVIDWSEEMVWNKIAEHKIMPHPAYFIGFSRVSCQFCIFCQPDHFALLRHISPERFQAIADMEKELNHTIDQKADVITQANNGSLRRFQEIPDLDMWVKMALSDNITASDLCMDPWVLPSGSYSGCGGGPT